MTAAIGQLARTTHGDANRGVLMTDAMVASGFADGLRELTTGRQLPTGWVDECGKCHSLIGGPPEFGVIVTDAEVRAYREEGERIAQETGMEYMRTDDISDVGIRKVLAESKLQHAVNDLEVLECLAAVDPRYAAELDQARCAHPESAHALACGTDADDSGDDAPAAIDEVQVQRRADQLYAECVKIIRRHMRIADDDPDALAMNIARALHRRYRGKMPSNPHRARQSISRRLRTIARRQLAQKERQGRHDSAD